MHCIGFHSPNQKLSDLRNDVLSELADDVFLVAKLLSSLSAKHLTSVQFSLEVSDHGLDTEDILLEASLGLNIAHLRVLIILAMVVSDNLLVVGRPGEEEGLKGLKGSPWKISSQESGYSRHEVGVEVLRGSNVGDEPVNTLTKSDAAAAVTLGLE